MQWSENETEDASKNQYWYSKATIKALVDEIQRVGTRVAFLSTPSLYFSLTDEKIRNASYCFDFDTRWKDPRMIRWDYQKPLDFPPELKHSFDMVVADPPFITEEVWAAYTVTIRALLPPGSVPDTPIPVPLPSGELDQTANSNPVRTVSEDDNPFRTRSKLRHSPPAAVRRLAANGVSNGASISARAASAAAAEPAGRVLLSTVPERAEFLASLLGVRPLRFRPSIPNLVYQYTMFANYGPCGRLDQNNPEVDREA